MRRFSHALRLVSAEADAPFGFVLDLAVGRREHAQPGPLLANGMVAGRVGYATPSAFLAAFRRAVGVPPAVYFGWPSSSTNLDFRAAPQPPDPT